jgi:hypothetical protein
MSKDIHVSHLCSHYIRFESYTLNNSSDVVTRSPINGSSLFSITKNDININQEGHYSSAEIIFPANAPYKINNPNYIFIYQNVSYPVKFDLGLLSASQIQNSLIKYLPMNKVEVNLVNQSIQIKDKSSSLSSRLEIQGDLNKFGFTYDKFKAQGKQVHAGWKLFKRDDGLGYFIRFNENVKGKYLISYTTEKNYCNRCASTGVENDLSFNEYGEIRQVEKHDLLYQQVAKVCLTKINSNPQHAWYGTGAFDYVGVKQGNLARLSIEESVRQALNQHINIQNQVGKIQKLSLEEQIASVRKINVQQVANTNNAYLVDIGLVSRANTPVEINIVFAVPGSIDLTN